MSIRRNADGESKLEKLTRGVACTAQPRFQICPGQTSVSEGSSFRLGAEPAHRLLAITREVL